LRKIAVEHKSFLPLRPEGIMKFECTDEERTLLIDLLSEQYSDIRDEIYRTESREFKDRLKHRKEIIEKILRKISHVNEGSSIESLVRMEGER
jgi:hypothetical protein